MAIQNLDLGIEFRTVLLSGQKLGIRDCKFATLDLTMYGPTTRIERGWQIDV